MVSQRKWARLCLSMVTRAKAIGVFLRIAWYCMKCLHYSPFELCRYTLIEHLAKIAATLRLDLYNVKTSRAILGMIRFIIQKYSGS